MARKFVHGSADTTPAAGAGDLIDMSIYHRSGVGLPPRHDLRACREVGRPPTGYGPWVLFLKNAGRAAA